MTGAAIRISGMIEGHITPGKSIMTVRTQTNIMINRRSMAICTGEQSAVIDRNKQPGIGKVTTDTGSRVMVVRGGVAGAAVAQGMVEDRIIPGGCVMAGTALGCKPLVSVVSWCLVAGHAISLWTVIHQDITPGTCGMALDTIP
ncbi:MAG: hypothetical protein CVU40_07575 [Chloroflexi bacterium HGW-Chloroflexi-2]|nr:MAG: hypothetical protein CVU40_07575 [Chloroflexi bacterium HGW-Chloroflexi-2]